jgi:cytochrome c5
MVAGHSIDRAVIAAARTRSGTSSTRRLLALLVASALGGVAGVSAGAQPVERSGAQVYEQICSACHASGVNGAPKVGDGKAWALRSEQGLNSLTQHALEGIRNMPPHGGNFKLTDIEIERGITYMVNRSGGHWTEPTSRTRPIADRTGEQIVKQRCVECHGSGKDGAPRIGDKKAWIARVNPGFDSLVRSAINGHGAMPPRGGLANLTDPELRSAIAYMVDQSLRGK